MQAAEDAQPPTHEDFLETRLLMKGDTDRREYLMANAGEDLDNREGAKLAHDVGRNLRTPRWTASGWSPCRKFVCF